MLKPMGLFFTFKSKRNYQESALNRNLLHRNRNNCLSLSIKSNTDKNIFTSAAGVHLAPVSL